MHKLSYDQVLLTGLFGQASHLDDILERALNGEQGLTTYRPYTNFPNDEYITGGRLIIPTETTGESYITAAKSWNTFRTGCNFKVSLSDCTGYVSLTVGPRWQLRDLSVFESDNPNDKNRKTLKRKVFFNNNDEVVGLLQYENNGSEIVETYERVGHYLAVKQRGLPPIMAIYDPIKKDYTIVGVNRKKKNDENSINSLNVTEKYNINEAAHYKPMWPLDNQYLPNCFTYYNELYDACTSQDESKFSFETLPTDEYTLSRIRAQEEAPNSIIDSACKLFNRANRAAQDRGLYSRNQNCQKIILPKKNNTQK